MGKEMMLNIALPKGRLGNSVYDMLEKIGYACDGMRDKNRKLILENPERGVRYMLVKPSDVAIYVQKGAADLGVVGKDILAEGDYEIYELVDLKIGKCNMCVAAPCEYAEEPNRVLRVATKFPNIAREYYFGKDRDIEIIKLSGSIEVAPILGISDVIVDIVETGTTLRENNLEVREVIMPISARLIANRSAYKFKQMQIDGICGALSAPGSCGG